MSAHRHKLRPGSPEPSEGANMTRRLIRALTLALAVTLPANAEGPVKDTITVGFATESTTLDPSRAAAGADYYFIAQMFEQLVRRGPDGKPVNWLAESYSIENNDGKPLIDVHLRNGVKFHNGDPLTSADFEV